MNTFQRPCLCVRFQKFWQQNKLSFCASSYTDHQIESRNPKELEVFEDNKSIVAKIIYPEFIFSKKLWNMHRSMTL